MTPTPPAPDQTTATPPTAVTTPVAPAKSGMKWVLIVVIVAILAVGGWYLWQSQAKKSSSPILQNSEGSATKAVAAGDSVTQQLNSISSDTSPSTLKKEISGTNLNDITPELENVSAATQGL